MPRFMKRPEYYDAILFTGENIGEVLSFIAGRELTPFEVPAGVSVHGPAEFPVSGTRIILRHHPSWSCAEIASDLRLSAGAWLLRAEDGTFLVHSERALADSCLLVDDEDAGRLSLPTKNQIKHMVDQFLNWRLPADFSPDCGISFEPVAGKGTGHEFLREPQGTNLLNASQARAMVLHLLEGLPEE